MLKSVWNVATDYATIARTHKTNTHRLRRYESTTLILLETAHPKVLEIRGLKRRFGNVSAVDGIDLNVYSGEIYGFLGVNGAGKTTTIRMLMGIIAAESGSMLLMNESTRRTTVRQKRSIGYVSQEQNFYPWMSCKMLGKFVGSFYPSWSRDEFSRLLSGFEIPESRKVSQLSGGMKAKLALALAITPKPQLLILDEPTAGLDPVARRDFMEIIVAQARQYQRTTFFSSHLIDEVERCADRIGIIHAGKMRFEGELKQLRDEVRRVRFHSTVVLPMPEPFQLWNERTTDHGIVHVYRAPVEAWTSLETNEAFEVERLSLEDIFIASVGSKKVSV